MMEGVKGVIEMPTDLAVKLRFTGKVLVIRLKAAAEIGKVP
jgi:predicted RNA-binding protein YlqC (UPF0109 family)